MSRHRSFENVAVSIYNTVQDVGRLFGEELKTGEEEKRRRERQELFNVLCRNVYKTKYRLQKDQDVDVITDMLHNFLKVSRASSAFRTYRVKKLFHSVRILRRFFSSTTTTRQKAIHDLTEWWKLEDGRRRLQVAKANSKREAQGYLRSLVPDDLKREVVVELYFQRRDTFRGRFKLWMAAACELEKKNLAHLKHLRDLESRGMVASDGTLTGSKANLAHGRAESLRLELSRPRFVFDNRTVTIEDLVRKSEDRMSWICPQSFEAALSQDKAKDSVVSVVTSIVQGRSRSNTENTNSSSACKGGRRQPREKPKVQVDTEPCLHNMKRKRATTFSNTQQASHPPASCRREQESEVEVEHSDLAFLSLDGESGNSRPQPEDGFSKVLLPQRKPVSSLGKQSPSGTRTPTSLDLLGKSTSNTFRSQSTLPRRTHSNSMRTVDAGMKGLPRNQSRGMIQNQPLLQIETDSKKQSTALWASVSGLIRKAKNNVAKDSGGLPPTKAHSTKLTVLKPVEDKSWSPSKSPKTPSSQGDTFSPDSQGMKYNQRKHIKLEPIESGSPIALIQ